jgi:hypothetical protein
MAKEYYLGTSTMFNINDTNGDSKLLAHIQYTLLDKFPNEQLYGVEFGVAFGGGIEQICSIWKDKGFVLGYDTFTNHPGFLAKDENSPEATAMDGWYQKLGKDKLSKKYIQSELEKSFSNFELIEGLVNNKTKKRDYKYHYVLLDFDLAESMQYAYDLIKDNLHPGGFICVHDIIPDTHMPMLNSWWFNAILPKENYKLYRYGKHLGVYHV